MDTYADDVAETIEALGTGPVDLAGVSMGGYILFSLWRRRPELVRSLIMVSTRSTEDPPEGKAGRKRVAALVKEKGTTELIEMMFPKLFSPMATEAARGAVATMIEELPPAAAAADSLAMGVRLDSTQDLAGISVPVLVAHGEADELMPLDEAKNMAARISEATFAPVPGAGHLTPVENPKAVSLAMHNFLKGRH